MYTSVSGRLSTKPIGQAKANDGAPGIDGVTFAAVEAEGVEEFLDQLRKELVERTYRPQRARKVEIPKGGGKMRQLSIPTVTS
jgi:RNA-directed DNA polymerase